MTIKENVLGDNYEIHTKELLIVLSARKEIKRYRKTHYQFIYILKASV